MPKFIVEWRIFILVAVFGCIGASVAFAIQATELIEIVPAWNHPSIQMLFQVLIGAFTSTIFIFLLSNTERTDLFRLVCLSMVAGFLWSPVLEVIKKYQIVSETSEKQTAILQMQAELILNASNETGGVAPPRVDEFLKNYATWRPLLVPSDVPLADRALDGVAGTVTDAGPNALSDTSIETLRSFQNQYPGVAVIGNFPGFIDG